MHRISKLFSGIAAEHVWIRAYGFQPGATVDIGFGPPDSAKTIIAHTVTDETGTVNVRIAVPGWADPGRDYVFVADGPEGVQAVSRTFRVIDTGEVERVTVTGVLTGEGVECPTLRSNDGKLYTLSGTLGGFRKGDRVTIIGIVVPASTCMQGTTLSVARIRAADRD